MTRPVAAGAMMLCLSAPPLFAQSGGEGKPGTYGDWTVICEGEGCRAAQNIHDTENPDGNAQSRFLARLFLSRSGGKMAVNILGPLNMALEAQMGLRIDGRNILLVPYRTCLSACIASAQFDEAATREIVNAGSLEIGWVDLWNRPHFYPVSTRGYGDALRALGTASGDPSATSH